MAVEDIEQVFEESLDRIYYTEKKLIQILDNMAKLARHPEVKALFKEHKMETQDQAKRIEEVFKVIGSSPKKMPAHELDGLSKDDSEFMREKPITAIKDFYLLGSAIKTEHLEMGHYEVLISMAKRMDLDDAVDLLSENLDEEEAALRKLKKLSRRFEIPGTKTESMTSIWD